MAVCLWIYLLGNEYIIRKIACLLHFQLVYSIEIFYCPKYTTSLGQAYETTKVHTGHRTHKSLLQAVSLALLHECSPLMSLAWASFRWSSADLWEVRVRTDYRSLHADFCSYSDNGCHVCLLPLHLLLPSGLCQIYVIWISGPSSVFM